MLNAQAMGFYSPAQIVRDARARGVEARLIDMNARQRDCTLEPTDVRYRAVRLGLRMLRDLANTDAAAIAAACGGTPPRPG